MQGGEIEARGHSSGEGDEALIHAIDALARWLTHEAKANA